MQDIRTLFSGLAIERLSELRTTAAALATARLDLDAGYLPVWNARCLVAEGRAALLSHATMTALGADIERGIFLGRLDGRYLFALGVQTQHPMEGAAAGQFADFRQIMAQLSEQDAGLLAYARAMVSWQTTHAHCGICGARNLPVDGGFVMQCGDANCNTRAFPRLDPAIIVLTTRSEKCLLGRQALWPEGRFSTIAGFVEPGESLEDSVRREVHEETNIRIGQIRYLASQPWPFPSALMIGFHAEALTEDIRLNDAELAEACWFSREDIADGKVTLPPPSSVAFRLIEVWFDQWDGPRLATVGVTGHFSSSRSKG